MTCDGKINRQNRTDLDIIDLNTFLDDSLLFRKKKLTSEINFHQDIPLPSIVEISESGTCNRVCSFCPRSAPKFIDKKEFIKDSLISKLATELSEVEYKGLILFSGFVEPLLDKKISDHIITLKEKLPQCRIEIVTNGDPITVKNLKKIYDAGLDALLVSCYDGEHQIAEISELIKQSKIPEELVQFRKRWAGSDENFGISLSNRGGMMTNAEFSIGNLNKEWENPCYYPCYTFFMDYTGEVLICAHDWGKKAVVGNLNEDTFTDIWNGKKFKALRRLLLNSNRKFKPCNICNVEGTRMGGEHAKAWINYFREME